MAIRGLEGMSGADLERELERGARFVVFEYCISVLIMSFKRSSDIHFIRPGEGTFFPGLPYTALSLLLGWWGFPWGLIYTPMAVITNLSGGKTVTQEVLAHMQQRAQAMTLEG